jgi:hypothetical protein
LEEQVIAVTAILVHHQVRKQVVKRMEAGILWVSDMIDWRLQSTNKEQMTFLHWVKQRTCKRIAIHCLAL